MLKFYLFISILIELITLDIWGVYMKKLALILSLFALCNLVAAETDEQYVDDGQYEDGQYEEEYIEEEQYVEEEQPQPEALSEEEYIEEEEVQIIDGEGINEWVYTPEEIARKDRIAAIQAREKAEYEQSMRRKRSGVFVGGGLGWSNAASITDAFAGLGSGKLTTSGVGADVIGGYQAAFNEYAGLRLYLGASYHIGNGIFYGKAGDVKIPNPSSVFKAHVNVDLYIEGNMGRNNSETLGVFLGIAPAYIFRKSDDAFYGSNAFGLMLNLGIHTILGNHHKIELLGRFVPYINYPKGTNTTLTVVDNLDAMLRYSYMF